MGEIKESYDEWKKDKGEVVCYIILTHYGTFYTGITNNLTRRWNEHKKKMSSYLSRYSAKEVINVEWFNTRKEARKKEVEIKRTGAKLYLLKQIHKQK